MRFNEMGIKFEPSECVQKALFVSFQSRPDCRIIS